MSLINSPYDNLKLYLQNEIDISITEEHIAIFDALLYLKSSIKDIHNNHNEYYVVVDIELNEIIQSLFEFLCIKPEIFITHGMVSHNTLSHNAYIPRINLYMCVALSYDMTYVRTGTTSIIVGKLCSNIHRCGYESYHSISINSNIVTICKNYNPDIYDTPNVSQITYCTDELILSDWHIMNKQQQHTLQINILTDRINL